MSNTSTIREVLSDLPQIETNRLLLRRMTLEDAEDMFAYASDPQVTRTTTWDTHLSTDDSLEFLKFVTDGYRRGEHAGWGIVQITDRKLIGTIGFGKISNSGYVAELGYALAAPYWGRGYMTEAARAIIDFGFRHMGLHRIEAVCRVDNVGSYRVMEKSGMTFEGTLREARYVKGRFDTIRVYSILRSEHGRR